MAMHLFIIIDMDVNEEMQWNKIIIPVVCLLNEYHKSYHYETPCMTSSYISDKWIKELLTGYLGRFHIMFHIS